MNTEHILDSRTVYVDTAEEQVAYLLATFGEPTSWETVSQAYRFGEGGEELEVALIAVRGEAGQHEIVFAPAHEERDPFGDEPPAEEVDRTTIMDGLMERAATFAAQNPPHHPGSLARFPVPSASYANAIAVPLPILAVDGHVRGLYAPPRFTVLSWPAGEAIGVGEYPDFDPETWPPPRMGDWPPASVTALPAPQLQGMIQRFSACWSRVLEAWFAKEVTISPVLRADVREALAYRATLDLPLMIERYERLNPVFAAWLRDVAAE